MPIQLTEPYVHNLGRGQGSVSYSQAKIIGFEARVEPADEAGVILRVEYGDTVDGAWVPGLIEPEHVSITDSKPVYSEVDGEWIETVPSDLKYTNWVGSTYPTDTSNLLYTELAVALYVWLLGQEGFEGTIV
jgi:hypothetical protein